MVMVRRRRAHNAGGKKSDLHPPHSDYAGQDFRSISLMAWTQTALHSRDIESAYYSDRKQQYSVTRLAAIASSFQLLTAAKKRVPLRLMVLQPYCF